MQTDTDHWLDGRVDRIFVINLESRPDRRREMLAELGRLGLGADSPVVTFFPAVRPDGAGAFASIGARGCFMSHLGVLKRAAEAGLSSFLILEDDAAFVFGASALLQDALDDLGGTDWSIAYLGHRIPAGEHPGRDQRHSAHWRILPPGTRVETTHAMLIHARAVPSLIAYLEAMLARPAGHPEGGPMHVDGAYSWFRKDNPDHLTLVTPKQCVFQRASRSDIARQSWRDAVPFLDFARRIKNRLHIWR